jgi:hypothetical protein
MAKARADGWRPLKGNPPGLGRLDLCEQALESASADSATDTQAAAKLQAGQPLLEPVQDG